VSTRRWLPLAVAGIALLAIALVLVALDHPPAAEPVAAAPAAQAAAAARSSPPSHLPPQLPPRPMPRYPTLGPGGADLTADGDPPVAPQTVALPDGSSVVATTSKARYAAGQPVIVDLEARTAAGGPLVDWRGASVVVIDPAGGRDVRPDLFEDGARPGHYYAEVTPEVSGRTDLVVAVTMTPPDGDRNRVDTATFTIDYGAPARMVGYPRGAAVPGGLAVDVEVVSAAATRGVLAGELRDQDGRLLGRASAATDLVAGRQAVRLEFPGVAAPPQGDSYWLAAGTLFAGAPLAWSDVVERPALVAVRE
jgi:hypothetical protein